MDIWEFYRYVDDLVRKYEQKGLSNMAARLKNAKMSGSTSGEILCEIGLVLNEFKDREIDGTIDIDIKRLRDFIEKALR